MTDLKREFTVTVTPVGGKKSASRLYENITDWEFSEGYEVLCLYRAKPSNKTPPAVVIVLSDVEVEFA